MRKQARLSLDGIQVPVVPGGYWQATSLGDVAGDGRTEVALSDPHAGDGGPERGAFWIVSFSDPPSRKSTDTTTTTTTTIDDTTTTTTCTEESCADDDSTWEVEFVLGESRPLGAVQFDVDYSGAGGYFVGPGAAARCVSHAATNILSAYNNADFSGDHVLTVGMISLAAIQGPMLLTTCEFHSFRQELDPGTLKLTLTDAVQANGKDASAVISVNVRRI